MLPQVPSPPPAFTRLEAPLQPEEELPTWDGTPFDVAYAVEVLYTPPEADSDLRATGRAWARGPTNA